MIDIFKFIDSKKIVDVYMHGAFTVIVLMGGTFYMIFDRHRDCYKQALTALHENKVASTKEVKYWNTNCYVV